jgi:hypothetical protein
MQSRHRWLKPSVLSVQDRPSASFLKLVQGEFMKDQSSSINQGLGVRQTAGHATAGSFVYFALPAGTPNEGKPRTATVVRAYQNEDRNEAGTLPENVDLVVETTPEDGVERFQAKVPRTSVGTFDPGTWRFQDPRASGF